MLDIGERDAIQLALDSGVHTHILMDDAEGREQARKLHLKVRGTLAVLERGAKLGLTELRQALDKLQQTNFRISESLIDTLLKRNPETNPRSS